MKNFFVQVTRSSSLRKQHRHIFFSPLSKLCKSKATGLDNIAAKLLRECPNLIAESLTYIFNQSL